MTKRQALKYSLIYILLILLGAFIAYKVWWTHGNTKYLAIISWFLISLGSLFLSISLTRLFFPTDYNLSFSALSNKQKYKELKETIGATNIKVVNLTYISLFLLAFIGTSYTLVRLLNEYQRSQLKTYGRLQTVIIKDIHRKGKGKPFAFFDFYLNGKKYSNDLNSGNYHIGDSATIIFSTDNPDIVKWADDFDNNPKGN